MEELFGDEIVTITDEDGKEYEMEVLARFDCNDAEYVALTDANAEDAEEMEVSILKVEAGDEDGDMLVSIDDENELEQVYQVLMDLLYEEEDTQLQ